MKQAIMRSLVVALVLASSADQGYCHRLPERAPNDEAPTRNYGLRNQGHPMQYWTLNAIDSHCADPHRVQQLEAIRQYLEDGSQRLSEELRRLRMLSNPSNLQQRAVWESARTQACKCEDVEVQAMPSPTSVIPPVAQSVSDREVGLFPGDAGLSDMPSIDAHSGDNGSSSEGEEASSPISASFFTGDGFVLVVSLVVAPVAIFIGLVVFCRRR